MATRHSTRRRTESLDQESREMLYEGLNYSQLGVAFRMDHRILVEKLHNVPPTGTRNGTDTWDIYTAAPHLVKPVGDIESYLKRMHHNDLPKHLSKEFWAAIKTRQDVEERSGDLWPTDRVVGVIGALMKLMKMSVRLMSDAVDAQAELSQKQRRIVKQLGDSMLEQLYDEVRTSFKPKKVDEKVLPVSDEAQKMAARLVEVLQLDDKTYSRLMRMAQEENDEL